MAKQDCRTLRTQRQPSDINLFSSLQEYESFRKLKPNIFNKKVNNEMLEARHEDLLHKFKLRGGLLFKDIEQELSGKARPVYREESDTDDDVQRGGGPSVRVHVTGYGDHKETFTVDKHKVASQSELLEKLFAKGSEASLSMQEVSASATCMGCR